VQKWDFDAQNPMAFGQEAVNSRRGDRIIAAFLSVKDGQVEVTARKSAPPTEDQGTDLLAVCLAVRNKYKSCFCYHNYRC
jgi:hypothetical protein